MPVTVTLSRTDAGYRVAFPYDPAMVDAVKTVAGRRFDNETKSWLVPKGAAGELGAMLARVQGAAFAFEDEALRDELDGARLSRSAAIEGSRKADVAIDVPAPAGLDYLGYQRAGIAAALARTNILIGDEMGLGKTVETIGIINADDSIRKVLVICPASLVGNWARRELPLWLVRKMVIATPTHRWVDAAIVVINYDILKRFDAEIHGTEWDLLVVDESHYLKNPKTQRAQFVIGKFDKDPAKRKPAIQARRKVFLTGTPIPNRPAEGWTTFHFLAPDVFKSWKFFVERYCGAFRTRFGWDTSGATNLPELQEKLRASILIRRLKADVLTELPAKRRQVIELPGEDLGIDVDNDREAWARFDRDIEELEAAVELAKASDDDDDYARAVKKLEAGQKVGFEAMSQNRLELGMAIVPQVIEHLESVFESGVAKVICFAWHKEVIAAIAKAFPGSAIITGTTPKEERQGIVDEFQLNPACRLFLGNIQAAGVGITLTAADHVVFAELDWVPGNITQAEDRAHRIGQRKSVLVQHLVVEGTTTARMAKRLIAKQAVIDQALDVETDPKTVDLTVATARLTREQVEKQASTMPAEQIAAIFAGLRRLSGVCDGAVAEDGVGFNGCDTRIGKSLAMQNRLTARQAVIGRKILIKYRRQLGDDLIAAIKGESREEEPAF